MWVAVLAIAIAGCGSTTDSAAQLQVELSLEPSPPVMGESKISLQLADAQGQPIENAQVRVEGNMNHAGMKPSFADLTETVPGKYTGAIDFTMGGDWFLLITATTSDGKSMEQKIDVPGVKVP